MSFCQSFDKSEGPPQLKSVSNLKFVNQKSNKIHEIDQFGGLKVSEEITHQLGYIAGNCRSRCGQNPGESKPSLKKATQSKKT